MKVIGICGSKRVGKDTIADMLSIMYGFEKVHIASKLKNVCKVLFDFTDDQLNSDAKDVINADYNTTPRKLLQFIGTDIMQYEIQKILNCGRDFWIDDFVKNIRKKEMNFVVSDLRFVHEYNKLKNEFKDDFVVIKVIGKCNSDDHIAENDWKNIVHDYEIINNSTIEDLKAKVDQIKF